MGWQYSKENENEIIDLLKTRNWFELLNAKVNTSMEITAE